MKNTPLDREYQRLIKAESTIQKGEVAARDQIRSRIDSSLRSLQAVMKKTRVGGTHLGSIASRITQAEAMDMSNKLDTIAEMAAFLGYYIEYRSHERAEKRRIGVRKALGYTYPKGII